MYTLLESINKKLDQLKSDRTTFDQYFRTHVREIADRNALSETTDLLRKRSISVKDLSKMIQAEHEKLAEILK